MRGEVRDAGWISGSEDPLEEGLAAHSSLLLFIKSFSVHMKLI